MWIGICMLFLLFGCANITIKDGVFECKSYDIQKCEEIYQEYKSEEQICVPKEGWNITDNCSYPPGDWVFDEKGNMIT